VASSAAMLCAAGVDVNAVDGSGRTALMLAAMHGHAEVICELLRRGVDVTAQRVMAISRCCRACFCWSAVGPPHWNGQSSDVSLSLSLWSPRGVVVWVVVCAEGAEAVEAVEGVVGALWWPRGAV